MSKILVIEDDNKIRSILKEILEEKNHEVDDAADGVEGLKKLEQGVYDLCLCDIKMPKMDGMACRSRWATSPPCDLRIRLYPYLNAPWTVNSKPLW